MTEILLKFEIFNPTGTQFSISLFSKREWVWEDPLYLKDSKRITLPVSEVGKSGGA